MRQGFVKSPGGTVGGNLVRTREDTTMQQDSKHPPDCLLASELARVKAQIRGLRARETALVRQLTCGGREALPDRPAQRGETVIAFRKKRIG